MPLAILENIRSAYNVGNIVRTADVLGRDIAVCGYTPSPLHHPKVQKTALNAQDSVRILEFTTPQQAIDYARSHYELLLAAEITDNAIPLQQFTNPENQSLALIFGNEVEGVEANTLTQVDQTLCIPLAGKKDSLNVGQAAAIMMRHVGYSTQAIKHNG